MGHKVSPVGFRVGVTEPWRSRWFTDKRSYGLWLIQDQKIREYLRREPELKDAGISRVEIERMGDNEVITVHVYAARVGLVIGSQGKKIDRLEGDLGAIASAPVNLKVQEVASPEMDAPILSRTIADELARRSPYRRVIRNVAERVMEQGAKGVKIQVKGRLGGAEIARKEKVVRGKVPLQTLRAEIDYGTATARLTKGTIGVKVWIYKGDRLTDRLDKKEGGPEAGGRGMRRRAAPRPPMPSDGPRPGVHGPSGDRPGRGPRRGPRPGRGGGPR
jgi:small subunit ribosomal protein S3